VARAAAQTGSRLLFLSSDYVFDGEKRTPYEIEDPRNPINVYGRFESEAERNCWKLFGLLHRSHLVAVRCGRQELSGHDIEAGKNPA